MAAAVDGWEDLPASVLRKIIVLVPCEADRRSTALVCRHWRAALAQRPGEAPLPLPPQLPWLLLPSPRGPAFSCLLHRGDGASGIHRVRRIPDDARYFGSYDGRWLFVAPRNKTEDGGVLLNIRSGERYSIPRESRPERTSFRALKPSQGVIMLVATLSAAPNADRCIGVAIVRCAPFDSRSRRQITFWRMGHQLAISPAYDAVVSGEPEDVVYYKGEFHFLTTDAGKGEHLFVCRLALSQHGDLQIANKGLRFFKPHLYRDYEQHPHVRYLVESRGELLMVVKWSPLDRTRREGVRNRRWWFTVFRMARMLMKDPTYHYPCYRYTWIDVPKHTLDGRILFIGKGCSRSYEKTDFPGFVAGVYFLDDYDKSNLDVTMENIQFHCCDNGFWSGRPEIERCFRPEQDMSACSPPVWLLP